MYTLKNENGKVTVQYKGYIDSVDTEYTNTSRCKRVNIDECKEAGLGLFAGTHEIYLHMDPNSLKDFGHLLGKPFNVTITLE